jgi:hypothetical protein
MNDSAPVSASEPIAAPVAPPQPVDEMTLLKQNNELLVEMLTEQKILSEQIRDFLRGEKNKLKWKIITYVVLFLVFTVLPFFIVKQVWNSVSESVGLSGKSASPLSEIQNIIKTGGLGVSPEMMKELEVK